MCGRSLKLQEVGINALYSLVSLGKFLGNELWKEHYGSLLCLVIFFKAGRHKIYGDDSQQEFGRGVEW